ncbi:MAG: DUF3644 domain-containing protein [Actinomycetota bacterium]|nr:DUF3644 domain-containing protein [Actinomycetota bacterium]
MAKPYVSYRRLVMNSKAAMVAAIEIYNKPTIQYRDETFVILVVNAWELLLKAILCKSKRTVFYKKKRNEPHRSYAVKDAVARSRDLIPAGLAPPSMVANIEHLVLFRDNAVHFYNQSDFSVLVYALGQTSVVNYNDVLKAVFGQGLEEQMALSLMPIGLKPPVDPIAFLAGVTGDASANPVVVEFVRSLAASTRDLEADGSDTGRLLTSYTVSLQSTKKIASADLVVGVDGGSSPDRMLVTQIFKDPNKAYPLREKDVLAQGLVVDGVPIGQYVFRAIVRKYDLKSDPKYCWEADGGVLTKYSSEVVRFLRSLDAAALDRAKREYSARCQKLGR